MELSRNQTRQSGVELLKILGMFLIVINHVTSTLQVYNARVSYHDYFLGEFIGATTEFQPILLYIFRYGGPLGNNIFFFCSAWFLLDKPHGSARKIPRILSDVWTVSVLILCVFAVCLRENLDKALAFRQLFPVIFQNNWYVTTYLLFLPMYPALNDVIRRMNRKALLRTIGFLFILVLLFFRKWDLFQWITYYFIIAYVKYYLKDSSANVKLNLVLALCGLIGIAVSIAAANMIGLRVAFLSGLLPRLKQMYNPFVILITISLLNLALRLPLKSGVINYIASMSMFVYIIHENNLVNSYLRPWIWQKIHTWGGGTATLFCAFLPIPPCFSCAPSR